MSEDKGWTWSSSHLGRKYPCNLCFYLLRLIVVILAYFILLYCRKGKTFKVYAKDAPREQGASIVVKFNPLGKKDPYLDDVRSISVWAMIHPYISEDWWQFPIFHAQVYKDYRILTQLSRHGIAPTPLFRSSDAEERIVGVHSDDHDWSELHCPIVVASSISFIITTECCVYSS